MDIQNLHDLTAAYVLDALDDDERDAFEAHLPGCERCQADLAELGPTADALAFGAEAATPPPALKGRILDAARSERSNVIPLRARRVTPVRALSALTAVAACAAVALGAWNVSLRSQLHRSRTAALSQVPVNGAPGSVVVSPGGSGALLLSSLAPAPAGKVYEAWVIEGTKASPAGVFHGGRTIFVKLTHPVPAGAVVAITVEPTGGSSQPTTKPFAVSTRV